MVDKAIEKLKEEISKNSSNQYIKFIGDFLIKYISEQHEAGEKILVEGKTIGGSMNHMASLARKRAEESRNKSTKKETMVTEMFTPNEGLEIVLKYFDINESLEAIEEVPEAIEIKTDPTPKKIDEIDFDISLDDFLK
ncbi:hypothetical protein [Clostridium intestinale]|uniref:Uncharacterized protein n=1 Tax=Clostridium intestinale TaxID=36845 RepID=A0A7D6ZFU1_9CLOT|nr:hypothetical protein [Clostridium intestinale]QLY79201.1 hypothetical protein HZF06_19310 [Clostridium intestinale]